MSLLNLILYNWFYLLVIIFLIYFIVKAIKAKSVIRTTRTIIGIIEFFWAWIIFFLSSHPEIDNKLRNLAFEYQDIFGGVSGGLWFGFIIALLIYIVGLIIEIRFRNKNNLSKPIWTYIGYTLLLLVFWGIVSLFTTLAWLGGV